jgi:DNA invertase Pin-like site-specific DNA recombinase
MRYSDGSDQDENSIVGQRSVIQSFAEREGYTIVGEYIDRGISGTRSDRESFLRMISDSEQTPPRFKYVLVFQLDRFARNRADAAIYRGLLEKNGVKLVSAKENIADNSSGIILQGVLETLAEYYSVELSEKVKRGNSVKAALALYLGGVVPLGFYIDESKHYQIKEPEASYVRAIFEMLVSGSTIREINAFLNENNVISTRGNSFTKNSLSKLFRNKKYIGCYTYGDDVEIPNGIPAIIDVTLFEKANMVLGEKKLATSKGKAKEEYILTPRLYCGICHSLMTGYSGTSRWGNLHSYYRCNAAVKKLCDKKSIKKRQIEDKVVSIARAQLTDENLAIIIREIENMYASEQCNNNIMRLKKAVKDCDNAIENLLKALELGQAADIITERLVSKQAELQQLKALLAKEELIFHGFDVEKVKFFLYSLKNGDINDTKHRKALLNLFIRRIYLFDDRITVIFNSDKAPVEITDALLDDIGLSEGSPIDCQGSPQLLKTEQ